MFVSCCVSESKPTCGVITSPPIRGQNVQLSCSMTYRRLIRFLNDGLLAGFSASISWESSSGTLSGNPSRIPVTNSDGSSIGETLQVEVLTLASGAEIPSYNCTSSFHFADKWHQYITFALNSVAWTCVSKPVITWCMYFSQCFKYFKIPQ